VYNVECRHYYNGNYIVVLDYVSILTHLEEDQEMSRSMFVMRNGEELKDVSCIKNKNRICFCQRVCQLCLCYGNVDDSSMCECLVSGNVKTENLTLTLYVADHLQNSFDINDPYNQDSIDEVDFDYETTDDYGESSSESYEYYDYDDDE